MKNKDNRSFLAPLVKRILLGLFVLSVMAIELQFVAIPIKAQIKEYENTVGEYYNELLEQPAGNMEFLENEALSSQIGFKTFTQKYLPQENNKLRAEEAEVIEIVDEYTTLREGSEEGVYELEISMVPLNYRDGEEYKEIVTTIETRNVDMDKIDLLSSQLAAENKASISQLSYEEKYPYYNHKNTYKVDFPYSLVRDDVLIEKNGVIVRSRPILEGELRPETRANEIVYPGTNDQSIRYQLGNGEFKEDYLIYSPYSGVFQSRISVENGSIENGDNVVVILDGSGNLVFYLRAPAAYDAAGNVTYDLSISYENGMVTVVVDEEWLLAEERVFPITVDPTWSGMAHYGYDTSISSSQPTATIGNPNLAANNWTLPAGQHHHAYMYYGQHPTYGTTISFYKMLLDGNNYFAEVAGKYIRRAYYSAPFKYASQDTTIYSCTLEANYNTQSATYNSYAAVHNMSQCEKTMAINPVSQNTVQSSGRINIDITDYVRGVFEENKANYGAIFLMNPDTGYVETYAHEFYYLDVPPKTHSYPSVIIEYSAVSEIDQNYSLDDTVIYLRPFVMNLYEDLYTQFGRLGIDGVAKPDSNVAIEIKHENTVIYANSTKSSKGSLFVYPDYPEDENFQNYNDLLESNYQASQWFTSFETGKLYEVFVTASAANVSGESATASFQLYEVKRFDLLSNIAAFYGVSVEQLMRDNNLEVEIVREGSTLFIANPAGNAGIDYPSSQELSSTDQQIIYDYLRGNNPQNEYAFGPVNLNTGNLMMEIHDFTYYVREQQFAFTRSYNSSGHNELGTLGWGWKHNNEYQLTLLAEGVGIILGDGTRLSFSEDSGVYTAENNRDYKLVKVDDSWVLSTLIKKYEFNSSGRLVRYENHKSEITEYEYENGLLTKIIYNENQELLFEYDSSRGLLTKVSKFDGNSIDFEYDEEGHLIKVYDELGNSVSYEYDENHYLTANYNRKQQREATYIYDNEGRVIEVVDGKNRSKYIEYYSDSTVEIDAKGNERVVHFDEYRQTVRIDEADGSFTVRRYDMGWIKNNKENGVFYVYEQDYKGNLLYKERVVDGARESYEYDQYNNLIKKTDVLGIETTYEYDSRNNLLREYGPSSETVLGERWVTKTGNFYELPQAGFTADRPQVFDNDVNTYVVLTGSATIEFPHPIIVEKVYLNLQGFSSTYYLEGQLEDGTWISLASGSAGAVFALWDPDEFDPPMILNGNFDGVVEIYEDTPIVALKVENYGGFERIKEVQVVQWQESEEVEIPVDIQLNYEYTYRGGEPVEYPEIEWWSAKTGRIGSFSVNNSGVGYDVTYGPYAIGNVRPKTIVFSGTVGNNDTYANGFYAHIDVSSDGGANWTTVGTVYIAIGVQSSRPFSVTANLSGETVYTHVRYRTTGKNHSRNYSAAVTAWFEPNPDQSHSENSSYVNGEYVCNAGYVGNGRVCDLILTPEERNQLIKMTDAKGNVTTYEYDENGYRNKINYPDGTFEYYVYNPNGEVTSFKDRAGYTTTYTLDERGELIIETNPDNTTIKYEYDADGNVLRVEDELNRVTLHEYDSFGNITKTTDAKGYITTYEYDRNDNLILVTYPDSSADEYRYDEKDRVIYEDKKGVVLDYTLNDYGIDYAINHRNNMMYNGYDEQGRVVWVSHYDTLSESYGYNLADLAIYKMDSNHNYTSYSYDDNRNLIEEYRGGRERILYEYNALNQLVKKTTINIGYSGGYYDREDFLTEYLDLIDGVSSDVIAERIRDIKMNGDPNIGFSYEYIVQEFIYDADGRVITEVNYDTRLEAYAYIVTGRKTTLQEKIALFSELPLSLINYYEYEGNQLVEEADSSGVFVQYEYDFRGNITKEIYTDGSYSSYYYDDGGQLIKLVDADGYQTQYSYDNNGNIIQKSDHLGRVSTYVYDNMNRLIQETSPLGFVQSYTYDDRDNLLTYQVNGRLMESMTYDLDNQVLTHTDQYGGVTTNGYDYYGYLYTVEKPSGQTIQYHYNHKRQPQYISDNQGKPLNTYHYDLYGNVTSESDERSRHFDYTYDGFGRLVVKYDGKSNRNYYYYSSAVEIHETDNTLNIIVKDSKDRVLSTRLYDKETDITIKSSKMDYDHLGNVIKEETSYFNGDYSNPVYFTVSNTFEYSHSGKLLESREYYLDDNGVEVSRSTSYEYDYAGNVIRIIDAEGSITQNVYDADQQLISTTNSLGGIKQYQYDSHRNLIKEINERGFATEYIYNNKNQIIQKKDALGHNTNYEYNNLNQLTKEINPKGKTVQYTYDYYGNVIEENHNSGRIEVTYTYDIYQMNLIEKNTKSGNDEYIIYYQYYYPDELAYSYDNTTEDHLVDNEYDQYGNLISSRDGEGNETVYAYDSLNRKISTTQANGTIIENVYDGRSQVISEKYYDEQGVLLKATNSEYDGFGRVVAKSLEEKTVITEYDNMNNVTKEIDALGNEFVYEYDDLNRKVKTIYPDGTSIRTEYDAVGNVLITTDQLGKQSQYVYDGLNRLIQEENARGYRKTYGYNSVGQLVDVQDERGSHVYYDYDVYGNQILESTNNKNIIYTYDKLNRLTKVEYYDEGEERFTYDLRGNITAKREKDGSDIGYSYDNKNQLLSTDYGSYEVALTYDEVGNIMEVDDGLIVEEFLYNELNQLVQFKQGNKLVGYHYDGYGNLIKLVYPDNSEVEYLYDLNGNLIEVNDVNDIVTSYVYNNMNLVTEKHTTGLPGEYYTYTLRGEIKEIFTPYNEDESKYLHYEYDEVGNLIETGERREVYSEGSSLFAKLIENYNSYRGLEESLEAPTRTVYEVVEYEYNERDEMVLERTTDMAGIQQAIQYLYNIHGDRIEVSQGQLSKLYSYNTKGQLSQMNNGSNTTYYHYNSRGDVVREVRGGSEKTYSYDERNKLVTVSDYNGTSITYSYDGLGNRIGETVEKENQNSITMNYVNNVNLQYPEVISMEKNNQVYNFSYGVERLAMNDDYYYHDGLGSVSQLIGSSGEIIAEYSYTVDGVRDIEYDPYIMDNMYGYRGEAHTMDGLQYLRARYYDPQLARFLMWDEYEGKKRRPRSKNRYAYGENNPNKYKDPSGKAVTHTADGGSQSSTSMYHFKTSGGIKRLYWGSALVTGKYQSIMYQNGVKLSGESKLDGKYYVNGLLHTGWIGSRYYVKGVLTAVTEVGGNVIDNGSPNTKPADLAGGTTPEPAPPAPTPPKPGPDPVVIDIYVNDNGYSSNPELLLNDLYGKNANSIELNFDIFKTGNSYDFSRILHYSNIQRKTARNDEEFVKATSNVLSEVGQTVVGNNVEDNVKGFGKTPNVHGTVPGVLRFFGKGTFVSDWMLGGVVSTVIGTFIDVINGEDAIDAFSENLVKGFVSAGVTTAIIGAASVKFVIAGGWVIALGVVVGLLVNAAYENNWFYLKDIADGIGSIIHAVKDGLDAFVDEMNAHYTKGMELWNDAYQTISEDQELMELAESMGVDLSPKIPVAQTSTKYGDTTSTYNDVFI